jgi:hypothetical protein
MGYMSAPKLFLISYKDLSSRTFLVVVLDGFGAADYVEELKRQETEVRGTCTLQLE